MERSPDHSAEAPDCQITTVEVDLYQLGFDRQVRDRRAKVDFIRSAPDDLEIHVRDGTDQEEFDQEAGGLKARKRVQLDRAEARTSIHLEPGVKAVLRHIGFDPPEVVR